MAIIRQVEVDIAAKLEQLQAEHKDEEKKGRHWAAEARKAAAAIGKRDGEPS